MLLDLIKDSIKQKNNEIIGLYTESSSAELNKKIISSFLEKEEKIENERGALESMLHLNIDDSGIFPSMTASVINRPVVQNFTDLIKLINETSISFNKVNVSFSIIEKKPLIILTVPFLFFDDMESLLFKNPFGYSEYNGENDESKNAIAKIKSIIDTMKITLLEASMSIDEASLHALDTLLNKGGAHEVK